jgi:hypothetical protein
MEVSAAHEADKVSCVGKARARRTESTYRASSGGTDGKLQIRAQSIELQR